MKDRLATLLILALGPANWGWFFATAYGVHAIACARPGLLPAKELVLGFAAAALIIAVWLWRRNPGRLVGMPSAGGMLNMLSVIAVLWTATAVLFVADC